MAKKYIDAEKIIVALRIMEKAHKEKAHGDPFEAAYAGTIDGIANAIDKLPAADVAPQWIPVTEKLPAYGEVVLLSMNGKYGIGYLVPTYDERRYEWHHSGLFYFFNEVDAWMPLPTPYKGGEKE